MPHSELHVFAENAMKLCKKHEEIADAYAKASIIFDAYVDGMRKKPALAKYKRLLDDTRDRYLSGFKKTLNGELAFPYEDPKMKEILGEIKKTIDKYGSQVYRLKNEEETSVLDNIIADIEKLEMNELSGNAVEKWIPLLKKANNDYKNASEIYLADKTEAKEIQSASKMADELADSLNNLFVMMFAFAKTSKSEELIKSYALLEELAASFR